MSKKTRKAVILTMVAVMVLGIVGSLASLL